MSWVAAGGWLGIVAGIIAAVLCYAALVAASQSQDQGDKEAAKRRADAEFMRLWRNRGGEQ